MLTGKKLLANDPSILPSIHPFQLLPRAVEWVESIPSLKKRHATTNPPTAYIYTLTEFQET